MNAYIFTLFIIYNYNYNYAMKAFIHFTQLNLVFISKHYFKKYINIRKTNKNDQQNQQNISQPYQQQPSNPKFSPFSLPNKKIQLTPLQQLQHEKLKIGQPIPKNKKQRMSQKQHQINYLIKHSQNLSNLFHILNRYQHFMSIKQHLNLFDKFVYFDNHSHQTYKIKIQYNQLQKLQHFEKYNKLVNMLEQILLKQQYPPQIYIEFIYTYSKLENQFIFNKAFHSIFLAIVEDKLMPEFKFKQQKQKQKQKVKADKQQKQSNINSSNQDQSIQKSPQLGISQVLSIENNIKLLQSLLRIFNHKINEQTKKQSKIILSIIRNTITYIHLPSTPSQIPTHILQTLLSQYTAIYPHIKLSNSLIKSLTQDLLTRIKNQGVVPEIKARTKNKEDLSSTQAKMVNSLKKLFLVEKLFLQQNKYISFCKDALKNKSNNLNYNPFNALQQRIHKHIITLLTKCNFRNPEIVETDTGQKNLWKHIQLISLLTSHVKLLFSKLSIEVLAKCQLLTDSYDQYEAIIKYLQHLYLYIIASGIPQQTAFTDKCNYFHLLSNSYQLLHLLLSNQIQQNIPYPIINNSINHHLFALLIKQFSVLTTELQIIVIWDIVQRDSTKNVEIKLVNQLISYMLKPSNSHSRFRKLGELWYVRLLVGNERYLKFIEQEQLKSKDQYRGNECFKTLVSEIAEYESFADHGLQYEGLCNQLVSKIVKHIQYWHNGQLSIYNLVSHYKKKSIQNCLFSSDEVKILQIYGKQLIPQNQKRSQVSNKKISKLKQSIEYKIKTMLLRTQLMLKLITSHFSNKQQQKYKCINQIMEKFVIEHNLLKYPGILTYNDELTVKRINAFVPNGKENQPNLQATNENTQNANQNKH